MQVERGYVVGCGGDDQSCRGVKEGLVMHTKKRVTARWAAVLLSLGLVDVATLRAQAKTQTWWNGKATLNAKHEESSVEGMGSQHDYQFGLLGMQD